jgi:hypothetical protein
MKELRKRTRELSERQDELQERLNQAQGAQQRQSLGASSQAQEAMEISEKQQQEIDQIMEDVRRISDESEIAEPLLSRQLSETFRRTDQDQLTEMLETTRQLSRLNMVDKAAELERQIHPEIESLEERIDQAAQSILGDGVESLRRARDLLDELSEDLNQEIAQATSQTGDPTGSSPQEGQPSQQGQGASPQENTKETPTQMAQGEGNPPGQGQNDSQEATEARGQGSGQTPGQGNDGNQGESEEIAQSAEGSSGQGQGNSPGQEQGQGRGSNEQPQERQELRNGQGQSELAQSWMNQGGGGNGGGESSDDPQGPLTGNEFREWTDQLREAEEMVDVPELQNDIAAIRDRAQAVRRELRNEGKEPQWDLVQLQIEKPLYEVKKRINEELAKRLSKEAVVPIDRDPVPQEFSDLVRTYYETLGEGR